MNPVKCFYWYHGIYLQIVNIWSWLVCMFVWNTGSLHHWIDVTLDPNPMVWKGNSWDTTSNKLGKNKYIISLKSNLENPYSVFPFRLQNLLIWLGLVRDIRHQGWERQYWRTSCLASLRRSFVLPGTAWSRLEKEDFFLGFPKKGT